MTAGACMGGNGTLRRLEPHRATIALLTEEASAGEPRGVTIRAGMRSLRSISARISAAFLGAVLNTFLPS